MTRAGRRLLFKTVDELKECIERYKLYLEDSGNPPTIAGLALFTGLDRQTIYNYQKRDKYFDTIKEFRDWIMMNYEEIAIVGKQPTGVIFLLKNYGYSDKQEHEVNGEIGIDVKWSE